MQKVFFAISILLLMTGCISGGAHLSFEKESQGGLPGSPTSTSQTPPGRYSKISSSKNYRSWTSISTLSFRGNSGFAEGTLYQMSDPSLETGIENTNKETE